MAWIAAAVAAAWADFDPWIGMTVGVRWNASPVGVAVWAVRPYSETKMPCSGKAASAAAKCLRSYHPSRGECGVPGRIDLFRVADQHDRGGLRRKCSGSRMDDSQGEQEGER